jgi:hypothetical protein
MSPKDYYSDKRKLHVLVRRKKLAYQCKIHSNLVSIGCSCYYIITIYPIRLMCNLRIVQSVSNKCLTNVQYTECGRNSELIINKNNILLKVIDTSFITSQFTMVLYIFFFTYFHFLFAMSLMWPPPFSMHRCT